VARIVGNLVSSLCRVRERKFPQTLDIGMQTDRLCEQNNHLKENPSRIVYCIKSRYCDTVTFTGFSFLMCEYEVILSAKVSQEQFLDMVQAIPAAAKSAHFLERLKILVMRRAGLMYLEQKYSPGASALEQGCGTCKHRSMKEVPNGYCIVQR